LGRVARAALAAVVAVTCVAAGAAATRAEPPARWNANVAAAAAYAERREGSISFAVADERGRLRGRLASRVYPVRERPEGDAPRRVLNRPSVRARDLADDERALLGPMIRRSANAPASSLVRLLGARPLDRLAARAGMEHFRLRSPGGRSEITARGQARFFRRIDGLSADRHRAYARGLLAGVVPSQRWGIPPAKPPGWRIFLKGGWGSGTGWVTHQAALLERGDRRISLAILTRANPSHAYGVETIEGVARRLLRNVG
jgi:hypothetical protein